MNNFIYLMFALDTNSFCLVFMICGWGFLIMRSMVPVPGLAVASFPVLVLGALAARILLAESPLVVGLERGPGLALTTGIGMIVSLAVVIIVVRLMLFGQDATGRGPELLRRQQ